MEWKSKDRIITEIMDKVIQRKRRKDKKVDFSGKWNLNHIFTYRSALLSFHLSGYMKRTKPGPFTSFICIPKDAVS